MAAALLGWAMLLRAEAGDEASVFGSKEVSETGLIGIIYDLKQTQKREPTGVTPVEYFGVIREFLDKGWEESVLNKYFRAARPLYTTQIYIPLQTAGTAPRAFGMEGVIKPSVWVVHYKGQVSPPENGTYRFLCYADDLMAVAMNGKTVCEGSRGLRLESWKSPEKKSGPKAGNGDLTYGDWIELKKDEPVDLDVIVGERPGGQFCAFLMYEKQGAAYPPGVYPIFQLGAYNTPEYPAKDAPPFLKETKFWKGYQ